MDLHTGTSYWVRRGGLPFTYPALDTNLTADVVVVGAGISGALIARELVEAGAQVVVLERHDVAAGSSAATTGLLLYEPDASLAELSARAGQAAAVRAYHLGLDAIDELERLTHRLPHDCGFSRRPSLYLASRDRDVPMLRAEYEARAAHGLPAEWLDHAALNARYSFHAPAAIYSDAGGEVDCYRLTHEVLADAVRRGAWVFDRSPVSPPTRTGACVSVTTDRGYTVRAQRVVWAAGYESQHLFRRPPGRLVTTWAFVSEPLDGFEGWADRCLIWETARPYMYVRTTDDGRLLVGGEDEAGPERHRNERACKERIGRLLLRVRDMFPYLSIDVAYAWAGTFATSDDGLPVIGEVEEWPGVWFALGYGGNGITFSLIAAHLIRDAWLGREHPDAGIFALPRRSTRAPMRVRA